MLAVSVRRQSSFVAFPSPSYRKIVSTRVGEKAARSKVFSQIWKMLLSLSSDDGSELAKLAVAAIAELKRLVSIAELPEAPLDTISR